MSLSCQARELVESKLVGDEFSDRLDHSYGVAHRASDLAAAVGGPRGSDESGREWYWCLGLLHDVGYAEPLSGHHAFDGAHLVSWSSPDLSQFAPHIAWHSTAKWEYQIMGLHLADPIPKPSFFDHSLLWLADFTTGPQGQSMTVEERVDEIRQRHRPSSSAVLAIEESRESLARAEAFIETASSSI